MESYEIGSPLPGRLVLELGSARDFGRLERFHYRARRPATWCQVWVVRYRSGREGSMLAGAGVLSYPTLSCHAREEALGIEEMVRSDKTRWINRHVRTISRVAVHPTFRSLGLARALVRCMLYHCPTRYVEALAGMGRAHPFFELAGMRGYPGEAMGPIYYLYDRHAAAGRFIVGEVWSAES